MVVMVEPLEGEVTFVKACKHFFGEERPVTFEEFKTLPDADREEIRGMLIGCGYNIAPLLHRNVS